MKNINKLLFSGLAFSLILSSCSVEKRLHNPGYHVAWKGGKHADQNETTAVREAKKATEAIAFEEEQKLASEEKAVVANETKQFQDAPARQEAPAATERQERPSGKAAQASTERRAAAKEVQGSKEHKQIVSKKAIKKALNQEQNNASDERLILLVILAILIPFIAVGIVTNWEVGPVLISILLSLLFWIPGIIYALIVVFNRA